MWSALQFIFGSGADSTLKLAETLGAFFGDITDAAMWKSLGWIAAGLMLFLLGLGLWLGKDALHVASELPAA